MRSIMIWLLLVCVTGLSAATKMTVAEFEQEIFRLTNEQRAKYGLAALQPEAGLAELARRHGRNMAANDFFEHKDPQGLEVGGRKKKYYSELMTHSIGENLAFFEHSLKRFSPSKVVNGWMNSPGHRANILEPGYTHLGVAVIVTGNKLYAVQNFASPIVRLLSALPKSYSQNKVYRLEFLYMDSQDARNLEVLLNLPDTTAEVPIGGNMYVVGVQPLNITWGEGKRFSVDVPFQYGKGIYSLAFGWGGGHYNSEFIFRVK